MLLSGRAEGAGNSQAKGPDSDEPLERCVQAPPTRQLSVLTDADGEGIFQVQRQGI